VGGRAGAVKEEWGREGEGGKGVKEKRWGGAAGGDYWRDEVGGWGGGRRGWVGTGDDR